MAARVLKIYEEPTSEPMATYYGAGVKGMGLIASATQAASLLGCRQHSDSR